MARPSKGARGAMTLRLPLELIDRIHERNPGDRHSFIIEAIEAKLENDNGKQAEARA